MKETVRKRREESRESEKNRTLSLPVFSTNVNPMRTPGQLESASTTSSVLTQY